MLVLSRKVGEQICVPQFDIVLTVLGVRGAKVRLGIAAPDEIAVVREELLRREPKRRGNAVALRTEAAESLSNR